MGPNKSWDYQDDVRKAMDQALEAEKGVHVSFETRGQAINFRQRAYAARKLDRERSIKLYEPGDMRRGTSAYDGLAIIVPDKEDWSPTNSLFIRKQSAKDLKIEEIK